MNVDAYVKTALTVIAAALVAIAINLWGERLSPSPAQAQTPLESVAARLSALEQTQKQQAKRLEALRAALESTVLNATRRGYFPEANWSSTVKWDPDVPPAGGN